MFINEFWQKEINMTMEGLLIGTGWHEVEMKNNYYIRWSGPEPKSSLLLNPYRNFENRLNIKIDSAVEKEIINELRIFADKTLLDITISAECDSTDITAIIPKDYTKTNGNRTKLTFLLPKTLPIKKSKGIFDEERLYGIALRSISIFPLNRSLFVAKKYLDPIPFDGLYYMQNNHGVRESVIQGLYKSAYDYFLKHNRVKSNYAYKLCQHFDECPGDIYDILKEEFNAKYRKIESKYIEEIDILRNTVYRQSDEIAYLKKNVTIQRNLQ